MKNEMKKRFTQSRIECDYFTGMSFTWFNPKKRQFSLYPPAEGIR